MGRAWEHCSSDALALHWKPVSLHLSPVHVGSSIDLTDTVILVCAAFAFERLEHLRQPSKAVQQLLVTKAVKVAVVLMSIAIMVKAETFQAYGVFASI